MQYDVIKLLHILFAVISITGFVLRGFIALRKPEQLQRRWLKITPHINDSLLLLSGITLAYLAAYNPLQHSWLAAKIYLLICYIGFGLMTLRFAHTPQRRRLYFILAILCFSGIVFFAVTKPMP